MCEFDDFSVVILSSDEYAKYSLVTISSLVVNNPKIKNIIVVSDYLSERSLSLYSSTEKKFNIHIDIKIIDLRKLDWINVDSRWPKLIMYQVLLLEIVPVNYTRCLCLEVDTLVSGDISYLGDLEMGDYILAGSPIGFGVSKEANPSEYLYLDEHVNERRVNGGVLLFNLKKMRQCEMDVDFYQRKYIEFGRKTTTGEVLLSSAHTGRILYLNTVMFNFRTQYLAGYLHRKYDVSKKKIIHYIDRRMMFQKPWVMRLDESERHKYFLEELDANTQKMISDIHDLWWQYAQYSVNYLELRDEMEIRRAFLNNTVSKYMSLNSER